jgi:hypothetical protein
MPVRQLTITNRLVINEQFGLFFALGFARTHFVAFARTQLDAIPLVLLAFWFHTESFSSLSEYF